ncbi:Uncharacterized protein Rs2_05047 [Raphanus sativus]|nr:Uncharacterized protein Rs2_05047 [Raphanus sativus]
MAIKDVTEESCGSRAVVAAAYVTKDNPRQHRRKLYSESRSLIQELRMHSRRGCCYSRCSRYFSKKKGRLVLVGVQKKALTFTSTWSLRISPSSKSHSFKTV